MSGKRYSAEGNVGCSGTVQSEHSCSIPVLNKLILYMPDNAKCMWNNPDPEKYFS